LERAVIIQRITDHKVTIPSILDLLKILKPSEKLVRIWLILSDSLRGKKEKMLINLLINFLPFCLRNTRKIIRTMLRTRVMIPNFFIAGGKGTNIMTNQNIARSARLSKILSITTVAKIDDLDSPLFTPKE
jgi:hypothetical protein